MAENSMTNNFSGHGGFEKKFLGIGVSDVDGTISTRLDKNGSVEVGWVVVAWQTIIRRVVPMGPVGESVIPEER